MEIEQQHRVFEQREGLVIAGTLPIRAARQAIKCSLPTMDHAVRLFDAVVERAGERGWLDPIAGETRRLFLRDRADGWLIPAPLLELRVGSLDFLVGPVFKIGGGQDDEAKPARRFRPQIAPRGPTMCTGYLRLGEGAAFLQIVYDDRGLWKETSQSPTDVHTLRYHAETRPYTIDPLARPPTPQPLSLLCRADLATDGHGIEQLAAMVAELDPRPSVAARVRMPTPLVGGPDGALARALVPLRRALWEQRVPSAARWVVIDGFDRTRIAWGDRFEVLGWGGSFDEAVSAWDKELAATGPRAAAPGREAPRSASAAPSQPRRGPIKNEQGETVGWSSGPITLGGNGSEPPPWPEATEQTVAAVAIPLPEPLGIEASWAEAGFRELRLVGSRGEIHRALVRDDGGEAFTLVGEGVIDAVDPATIDSAIDAADVRDRASWADAGMADPLDDPDYPSVTQIYRVWDDARRQPMSPRRESAWAAARPDAGILDGDVLRWAVARRRQRAR